MSAPPSPDELDKLLAEFSIGEMVCVACKHDVFSHYWNGTFDWDACHEEGCGCKGEWDEPKPNTVDACNWLKREFVPSAEFKQALLALIESENAKALEELVEALPDDKVIVTSYEHTAHMAYRQGWNDAIGTFKHLISAHRPEWEFCTPDCMENHLHRYHAHHPTPQREQKGGEE